jgi:hypothetical protein
MDAPFFLETSVYFQRTAQRYITEDRNLHNHSRENVTSSHYDRWAASHEFCVVSDLILYYPTEIYLNLYLALHIFDHNQ